MKKALTILLLLSSTVYAGGVWTPSGKISSIDEYGNGSSVKGVDLSANPANCTKTTKAVTSITDATKQNKLNSILLTAFIAKKSIKLKLNDNLCNGPYPTYYAVEITE